ncbi:MAG: hypothetical protein SNI70_05580 [Rikenellaceae bacterium]
MKNIISMSLLSVAIMICTVAISCANSGVRTISSVAELAEVAALSNTKVKMTPGVYQMKDYLTPKVIRNTQFADAMNRKAMILFSGSGNTFDLEGVNIEIDTELLGAFDASINEIQITGANNTIKGLTITDIGNNPPTTKGARSFVITGDNNKIDGVTLNMSGSHPLGYGDLLGKGSSKVTRLNKHSGLLVEGLGDTIVNCSIYSKSLGHLFFVQGGRDVYFENCYAEAVVRSTDDMLAEKSGVAYDINFKSVYKNRDGESVITPGYVKSLSECGFRNYGTGGPDKNKTGKVTLVNCRAKNTRIGFAFTRMDEDMNIENCEAQGCEVSYYLSGVDVKSSRGDAQYGPLLNMSTQSDKPCNIELELFPTVSDYTVHCLAAIRGNNHKIKISNYNNQSRTKELPILIGTSSPAANNGFSPMGKAPAVGVELINATGMAVELNTTTSNCTVTSDGKVTDNGTDNKVK